MNHKIRALNVAKITIIKKQIINTIVQKIKNILINITAIQY